MVVGGGPAGSTAATLMAQQGLHVVLMEQETFPRYHIGESLLPSVLWFLDLLGAREKIDAIGFVKKPGSYFEWGPDTWFLNFGLNENEKQYSYQVERDCFDHVLLEHAKEQGVSVISPARVHGLRKQNGQYCCADWSMRNEKKNHCLNFKYMIDASGRAGIIAKDTEKTRHFHEVFKNVAIWGYWKNIDSLKQERTGAIAIGSIEVGWVWLIPLRNGITSIGVVLHKSHFLQQKNQDQKERYLSLLSQSPMAENMIRHGQLTSKVRMEQDYSYAADAFSGNNYFLVGDAACFLDPLLSTGVHLAMLSSVMAAASICSIHHGIISKEEGTKFYDHNYRLAYIRLLVFVSGFYQQYRGKQSFFWEAQRLTRNDYQLEHIQSAFLNLVSGLEDLTDLNSHFDDKVLGEMQQRIANNLQLRGSEQFDNSQFDDKNVKSNAAFFGAVAGLSSLHGDTQLDNLTMAVKGKFGVFRTK